jgi:hypothetical protein
VGGYLVYSNILKLRIIENICIFQGRNFFSVINCSKIGSICPHTVEEDPLFIFVIMPFDGFGSVYDIIKQSISKVKKYKFKVERADEQYTNLSIWCTRICRNIRKSKFCIVDTTGKNANVFYELGFAHALSNTKTIIITQNILEAPFDIQELGHIVYSEKELPKLRNDLTNALNDLLKIDLSINNKQKSNNLDQLSEITISRLVEELKPHILKEFSKDKLISEIFLRINQDKISK